MLTVTLGAAAVTANQDAGGYICLMMEQPTIGQGCCYKIKGHDANAGSLTLRVNLYDGLATPLTWRNTSKATLYTNAWNGVVVHPATGGTILNRPTGVPLVLFTASTPRLLTTPGSRLADSAPSLWGLLTPSAEALVQTTPLPVASVLPNYWCSTMLWESYVR